MSISIKNGITIPEQELEISTTGAGGPGGQHVNKTDTRVIIKWNVSNTTALSADQKQRVLENLSGQISKEGNLIIQHGSTRSQARNKKLAIKQLANTLRSALHVPKKRKKTSTPKSVKEKRLKDKKKHSMLKRMRSKKFDDA